MYRELEEIRLAELGPDHLETGAATGNRGFALLAGGRPDTARPLLERARAIAEAAGVPRGLAWADLGLAQVEWREGSREAAALRDRLAVDGG